MAKFEDALKHLESFEVQYIDECAVNFNRKKDYNEITFGTTADFGFDGTKKLGIVVWVDREEMKSAIDKVFNEEKPQ